MPTARQIEWIRKHAEVVQGPVLDVGSRIPETRSTSKIERFSVRMDGLPVRYPPLTVTGVDMIDGPNVDVVTNLEVQRSIPALARIGLKAGSFRTVYALSVLEHSRNPFMLAKSIIKLMPSGGWLFVSVPFLFRYHAHPDDYWRFTPQALDVLFDELTPVPERSEIWMGHNERIVDSIMETRAYVDRDRRTLPIVTVNRAFVKGTAAANGVE